MAQTTFRFQSWQRLLENIADTVIADGFRTWDEICVGDFALNAIEQ